MVSIVYATYDDWAGLYIDGKLEFQDHEIEAYDWIQLLNRFSGQEVNAALKYVDSEWLHEIGRLPDKLEDVEFAES